ncbi:MAG: Carboxyl-terminal protease [Bryobacterales bacterium]|nr:Carboxyl-terminal protease [Bryobacterales bacterium]
MTYALLFRMLLFSAIFSVAAGDGIVGITVDRDFTIVSAVLPEGPAAQAGVHAGDQIIAVDGYPTAEMRNLDDFAKRVLGGVGSEIDLELLHRDSNKPFHIRVRRVPALTAPPSLVPPGFDAHQVRGDMQGPNQAMDGTQHFVKVRELQHFAFKVLGGF